MRRHATWFSNWYELVELAVDQSSKGRFDELHKRLFAREYSSFKHRLSVFRYQFGRIDSILEKAGAYSALDQDRKNLTSSDLESLVKGLPDFIPPMSDREKLLRVLDAERSLIQNGIHSLGNGVPSYKIVKRFVESDELLELLSDELAGEEIIERSTRRDNPGSRQILGRIIIGVGGALAIGWDIPSADVGSIYFGLGLLVATYISLQAAPIRHGPGDE